MTATCAQVYSNYAVGYNNVVVPEATKRGIAVGNTPGVLTETTAEMACALMFGAARRLPESEVFTKRGDYEGWLPDLFLGKRLWGGTLGIIGAGRIGAMFARMVAPGHNMNVVYYDLFKNQELEDFFDDFSACVRCWTHSSSRSPPPAQTAYAAQHERCRVYVCMCVECRQHERQVWRREDHLHSA